MKTKIVVCPTLRYAFYEWHRLADTYSDMWANICRKPMSLTSKMGVKYIFLSENETDKLKGFHGEFISWDEVEPQEISDRNLKMWHDVYAEEKRRERSE